MILSLPQMQDLAAQCAPHVATETLLAVAKVESGFNSLAIGVNGKPVVRVRAANKPDAVSKASALIAAGRNVDLGVAQINSRNLSWLGLTVETAFDPCRNLAASARVLQDGYARSDARRVGEQPALHMALSYYNTGDPQRGFHNGYVAKVTNAAAQVVSALRADAEPDPEEEPAPPPPRPSWDVFGAASDPASFVIRIASQGGQE